MKKLITLTMAVLAGLMVGGIVFIASLYYLGGVRCVNGHIGGLTIITPLNGGEKREEISWVCDEYGIK